MKFRIISDLHLDHYGAKTGTLLRQVLPVIPGEKEQVCLIAGDMCSLVVSGTWQSALVELSTRFRQVVWCFGNHEFYGAVLDEQYWKNRVTRFCANKKIRNVIPGGMADSLTWEKEQVTLIHSTLWTDFDRGNPLTMLECSRRMNDYLMIREECRWGARITPDLIQERFDQDLAYIRNWSSLFHGQGMKVVVMTHHGPSRRSISPAYRESAINGGFCSDILESSPELASRIGLWVHGHVHRPVDYTFPEGCRVICNPVGYAHEGIDFSDELVVDL